MSNDQETKNSRAWFKDPDSDPAKPRSRQDGGLFGWTVLILLLIGVAIFCWIGSYYIFGHPDKPLSYEVLSKLKKIEPPKRFELTAAPRGEFLRAPQLLDRYGSMRPRQLERTNETLLRNYLRNFKPCDGLVPYVLGTFNILDSFELTGDDFFPSGVVALAQSKENPNLLLEQVFCADARMVPTLHRTLLTGLDIDLKRENELAAIINIERLSDGRIKLTTVSILYPSYESASADGTFTLDPPEKLHIRAGLPIIDTLRQREADAKYEHFRRKARLAGKEEKPNTQLADAKSRLMRVEKPLALEESEPATSATPIPSPTPAPRVVAALPVEKPVEVRAALPISEATPPVPTSPVTALPATPVNPLPKATPTPAASPTPKPTLVAEAKPTPSPSPSPKAIVAAGNARNWQTYEPGRMPRGRLLGVSDISSIAKRGTGGERVYLQGNFEVTASGSDRAVLRSPRRAGNVRVIVQYPDGMSPPTDGSNVARDERRPFQVLDVRESTGGQINVYVREVTRP
jgi:hypothetical protein